MAKNIVICADGTGNLGGKTPDSNVFKMYKAIDIRHTQDQQLARQGTHGIEEQMTFYDNGVGTASNKYWRAFTGAFGLGFKRNVCDLYRFLSGAYQPGDHVFLFGFSRGAAEVRAFSGFIDACGLVDASELNEDELEDVVEEAFTAYKVHKKEPSVAKDFQKKYPSFGVIPIKFIGVWDTVSALGWPQDWNVTGPVTFVLNKLFSILDFLSEKVFPHRFYNFELTPNVQLAFQALAVDDERRSFSPKVWDENLPVEVEKDGQEQTTTIGEVTTIEQVWFPGAHSNVGGGYGRAGLANVALNWMMTWAGHHGLLYKADAHEKIQRNANVHGRLHDSRDGFGVFYRYQPRDIQKLCWEKGEERSKIRGAVKIHQSVLERMKKLTANYAPGHLPNTFKVVSTTVNEVAPSQVVTLRNPDWGLARKEVDQWVLRRQRLYGVFLSCVLVVVGGALWFWRHPPTVPPDTSVVEGLAGWIQGGLGHVAGILTYILPKMFGGLIIVVVKMYPLILVGLVAFLIFLMRQKASCSQNTARARNKVRQLMLRDLPTSLMAISSSEEKGVEGRKLDVTWSVTAQQPDEVHSSGQER